MHGLKAYRAANPVAALVLAHGAGAGQTNTWMVKAALALSERGITVFTFDFPYMAAGRKVPDRAPVLEASWREALESARAEAQHLPIFIGGKSMGGRIATHIAAQGIEGVSGIVLLGYPLHPPGAPEKRRDAHLPDVTQPVLFVQGANDPFGNEHEIAALLPMMQQATLRVIETGDHSLKVKGGATAQQPAFDDAMDTVVGWIRAVA
ncbi:MAG TPA: alpha/beta fold hydrolase [Vicinamibacterales bacterium]|nr:alpha/beta fold hydrolase [Vicinamibacterales bacterium]